MPAVPLQDTVSEKKKTGTQGCCCFERSIIIFMCYGEHQFVQSQAGQVQLIADMAVGSCSIF